MIRFKFTRDYVPMVDRSFFFKAIDICFDKVYYLQSHIMGQIFPTLLKIF